MPALQNELAEVQQKVSIPSWMVPGITPNYLYRRSLGKHPDTPNIEYVNTVARF